LLLTNRVNNKLRHQDLLCNLPTHPGSRLKEQLHEIKAYFESNKSTLFP
jgi:hypothetical protein